jgi:hypothetical protein
MKNGCEEYDPKQPFFLYENIWNVAVRNKYKHEKKLLDDNIKDNDVG